MSPEAEVALARRGVRYLPQLMLAPHTELAAHLKGVLSERQLAQLLEAVASLPALELAVSPPAEAPLDPNPSPNPNANPNPNPHPNPNPNPNPKPNPIALALALALTLTRTRTRTRTLTLTRTLT